MLQDKTLHYGMTLLFVVVLFHAAIAQEREQYGRIKKETPIYLLLNQQGELVVSHADDKAEGKMIVTIAGDKEGNSLLRVTYQDKRKYIAFPIEKPLKGDPLIRLVDTADANCKWKRTELFPEQSDSKQPIYSDIYYSPSHGDYRQYSLSFKSDGSLDLLVSNNSRVAERLAYDNLYDGK
jgi:hypothetical protein